MSVLNLNNQISPKILEEMGFVELARSYKYAMEWEPQRIRIIIHKKDLSRVCIYYEKRYRPYWVRWKYNFQYVGDKYDLLCLIESLKERLYRLP